MFEAYVNSWENKTKTMSEDEYDKFYNDVILDGYWELCDMCREPLADFILNTAENDPTDKKAVEAAINPTPHAIPYVELPDGTEQACKILRQSPDLENVLVRLNKETEFLTETQFINFKSRVKEDKMLLGKVHNYLKKQRTISCQNGYGIDLENVHYDQFVQDVADGCGIEWDDAEWRLSELESKGLIAFNFDPSDDTELISVEVQD